MNDVAGRDKPARPPALQDIDPLNKTREAFDAAVKLYVETSPEMLTRLS